MHLVRVLLLNCFLLVVPVLAVNLLLTARLPRVMFGREVFEQRMPRLVTVGENVLRVVIVAAPLLIPLRWRPVGLAVYAVGLVLYVACWVR